MVKLVSLPRAINVCIEARRARRSRRRRARRETNDALIEKRRFATSLIASYHRVESLDSSRARLGSVDRVDDVRKNHLFARSLAEIESGRIPRLNRRIDCLGGLIGRSTKGLIDHGLGVLFASLILPLVHLVLDLQVSLLFCLDAG